LFRQGACTLPVQVDLIAANLFAQNLEFTYRQSVKTVMLPSSSDMVKDLWTLTPEYPGLLWRSFPDDGSSRLVKRGLKTSFRPFQIDPKPWDSMLFDEDDKTASMDSQDQLNLAISDNSKTPSFRRRALNLLDTHALINHILMVSWTAAAPSFASKVGKAVTLQRELWVTAHPQLQQFCQSIANSDPVQDQKDRFLKQVADIFVAPQSMKPASFAHTLSDATTSVESNSASFRVMRVLQYLGLPLTELPQPKRSFVRLWVNPKDIARPCIKGSLTLSKCALSLIWSTEQKATMGIGAFGRWRTLTDNSTLSDHDRWVLDMATKSSIYAFDAPRLHGVYPWTRLGYTYDWGGGQIGASEFVVRSGARVIVEAVDDFDSFCEASTKENR
jgi:hypothetical protein